MERHARILSSNPIEILQQQVITLVGIRWCQIFENILGIVVLSEGTMNYVSSCIVNPSCHLWTIFDKPDCWEKKNSQSFFIIHSEAYGF
jgi:hypothetical protein